VSRPASAQLRLRYTPNAAQQIQVPLPGAGAPARVQSSCRRTAVRWPKHGPNLHLLLRPHAPDTRARIHTVARAHIPRAQLRSGRRRHVRQQEIAIGTLSCARVLGRTVERYCSLENVPCVAPRSPSCPVSPSGRSRRALPHAYASVALSAPSARPAAAHPRRHHRLRRRRCCRRPLRGFGSVSRTTGTAGTPCQAPRARC